MRRTFISLALAPPALFITFFLSGCRQQPRCGPGTHDEGGICVVDKQAEGQALKAQTPSAAKKTTSVEIPDHFGVFAIVDGRATELPKNNVTYLHDYDATSQRVVWTYSSNPVRLPIGSDISILAYDAELNSNYFITPAVRRLTDSQYASLETRAMDATISPMATSLGKAFLLRFKQPPPPGVYWLAEPGGNKRAFRVAAK